MTDARETLNRLELVIFDCDGVLVDSEPLSNAVLAQLLTSAGLPTTLVEARRTYQGLLLAQVLRDAEARLGRKLPDDFLLEYERQRNEAFRRELKAVAGAADLLARVRASRCLKCVASQGKLEKTRLSLQLTGLGAFFAEDAVFSAYTVPRGKPHPDLFLHAAATMGVDPSRCVVVEDTVIGVTAGVAAGMSVIGYAGDSDENALRSAGADVIHTLSEVAGRLHI
jgi:HAD superfamily hydrolase (TIGR01509 family)